MSRKWTSAACIVALLFYTTASVRGDDEEPLKNAKLTILSNGRPCTIKVDGQEVGEAPAEIFVTPEEHTIEATTTSGEAETTEKTVTAVAEVNTIVRFDFDTEPVGKPEEDDEDNKAFLVLGGVGLAAVGGGIAIAASSGGGGGDDDSELSGGDPTSSLMLKTNLQNADGDKVDVTVNNVKVLDDYELTTAGYALEVEMVSGMNFIIIEAQNVGSEPPNTGILKISDSEGGKSEYHWYLQAGERINYIVHMP